MRGAIPNKSAGSTLLIVYRLMSRLRSRPTYNSGRHEPLPPNPLSQDRFLRRLRYCVCAVSDVVGAQLFMRRHAKNIYSAYESCGFRV
jgi:hypothetical protein